MLLTLNHFKRRTLAASVHFGLSLIVAAVAALLVFVVWYPYPYREISGGRELFLLVVAVDVIMGPLMTFAVFNLAKPRGELFRDLTIIGLLQTAALAYGLWTVAVARPVYLVFEVDRFRVVHAIEVPTELLNQAPAGLQRLPLTGPTLLSVRDFKDSSESLESVMAELQGAAISFRPDMWQSYATAKPQVVARARPLAELKTRFPSRAKDVDVALAASPLMRTARPATSIGYIPMTGRNSFWTVLVDVSTAEVLAFISIDSF